MLLPEDKITPHEGLKHPPVVVVAEQPALAHASPTDIILTANNVPAAKPRKWTDPITREVFIRKFRGKQDEALFHPQDDGVPKLLHPSQYEQLKGFDVTERTLVTERSVSVPQPAIPALIKEQWRKVLGPRKKEIDPHDPMYDPSTKDGYPLEQPPKKSFVGSLVASVNSSVPAAATITLWEKKAEPGKPHVIFFTGRSGHVADIGNAPFEVEGYNRHASIEFLADLAKAGVGFTVVTLRGYGNNKGKPSEAGFRKDINVFLDDWMKRSDRPPSNEVIASGYSLGAANAAILASEMTKRGEPPAVLALANAFSSMVRRGKEYIDDYLSKAEDERLKGLTISEDDVRNRMLDHTFDTNKRLTELEPATHVCIGYSSKDEVTNADHSRELAKTARELGLPVYEECYEGRGHFNVPTQQLAVTILKAYEHSQSPEGKERANDRRMRRTHDGVFVPARIVKIASRQEQQPDQGNSMFR